MRHAKIKWVGMRVEGLVKPRKTVKRKIPQED